MSETTEFYKLIAKDIKKWINKKFPEGRKVRASDADRGPFSRFSNKDLVEIALEIKKELRGASINPSVLQQCTGGIIGRQTWTRRISEEIDRINTPVIKGRELGLEDDDEINHVNIDLIVEQYGGNPQELVNQLYHIEESRIRLYRMVKELKAEKDKLKKFEEENKELLKQNTKLIEELHLYLHLSNNIYVSSYFPDLRKEWGVPGNALEMNSNPEKNANLNVSVLFPSSKELAATKEKVKELIEPKEKNAGEELVGDIIEQFGNLIE